MFCEYLKLPEDAACVSVIVLPQGDVLNCSRVALQVTLHVFKEPRFEVQTNSINLSKKED